MKEKFLINFQKIFNIFIVISPILCIYTGFIPGVNLLELLMIVFILIQLVFIKNSNGLNKKSEPLLILLLFYIIIIFIVNLSSIINNDMFLVLARLLRIILQIYFTFYMSKKWFCFNLFKKYIVNFSLVVSMFLLVQSFAETILSIKIPGVIKSLQYSQELGSDEEYLYRASSFFLEPAHLSQYLLIPLTILIFDDFQRNFYKILIYISAIILSMSGIGLIVLLVIVILLLIKLLIMLKYIKLTIRNISFVLLITFVVVFVFSFTDFTIFLEKTVSRFLSDDLELMGAFDARFEGYNIVFNEFKSNYNLIIGMGYGNTLAKFGWFSTIAYYIYCCGIIGTLLFVFIFFKQFIKFKSRRYLIIILLILAFLTDAYHNSWFVFLMSPLLYY